MLNILPVIVVILWINTIEQNIDSRQTTLKQRRINVEATSWRRLDVDTTFFDA